MTAMRDRLRPPGRRRVATGLEADAWERAVAAWHIDQVVEVTVARHVAFGVFVDLPDGLFGLVENHNLSGQPPTPDRVRPPVGTRLDAAIIDFVDRHQQFRLTIRPDHVAARRGETPWRAR